MSRISGKPQSGYTQLLEGTNLATARAVNLDIHHKHCYQIAKFIRGMNAVDAIEYLEKVMVQEMNLSLHPHNPIALKRK